MSLCPVEGRPVAFILTGAQVNEKRVALQTVDRVRVKRRQGRQRELRNRLRSWGKRPLMKHRGFAPYDRAANARMDQALYRRRSLVETVISVPSASTGLR